MSNHHGPEGCAPDDQRCEAMVRASKSDNYWEWTRHDRRCSKKAQQFRAGMSVCYQHANSKKVERWTSED